MIYKDKTTSKQVMQKQMDTLSSQYWRLSEKPKTLQTYNEQKQMAANYFFSRNAMDEI